MYFFIYFCGLTSNSNNSVKNWQFLILIKAYLFNNNNVPWSKLTNNLSFSEHYTPLLRFLSHLDIFKRISEFERSWWPTVSEKMDKINKRNERIKVIFRLSKVLEINK